MPTLDLGNWLNITDLSSPIRLLAAMAHPNEPDKQKGLIASIIGSDKEKLIGRLKMNLQKETIKPSDKEEWKKLSQDAQKSLKKNLESAFNSSGGIQTIIDSPDLKQIGNKYGDGCYKGIIAGLILFSIKQMKEQEENSDFIGGGSVNKAVDLISTTRKIPAEKEGKGISPASIRQYWTKYKSVSHLWAAYIMWGYAGKVEEISPHRQSSLPVFLALAEDFRRFGESYISHGQTGSLLSKGETWRPPTDAPLYKLTFNIPPLTPPELEALKNYRPPIPT